MEAFQSGEISAHIRLPAHVSHKNHTTRPDLAALDIDPAAGGLARFYASPISPSVESEALRTLSAAPLLAAELTSLCLPPSAQVFMALDAGVNNICKVLTGPRH
jgi:hypothetical protein